jgi:hypothetical protein
MIAWGIHGDINMLVRKGQNIFSGHKSEGCPRCGGPKPLSSTTYRGNKGVRKLCCIECEPIILAARQRAVARVAKWREQLPDLKERRNKEAREHRKKLGDTYRVRRKKMYAKNKEKYASYQQTYRKKNPYINRAAAAQHRALILQRTPKWADLHEIKMFYKNCPSGMVVDHIVPLRGKNVCGLHIRSNLQYLTAEENGSKSNKFDVSVS